MAKLRTFLDPARDSLKAISRSMIQLAVSGAGCGWIVSLKGTGKGYTIDTLNGFRWSVPNWPDERKQIGERCANEYEFEIEFEDDCSERLSAKDS